MARGADVLPLVRAAQPGLPTALLIGAALVTLLAHDGTITDIGPIHPMPPIRSILLVPLLQASAAALIHPPWPTPVAPRGLPAVLARALAHGLVVLIGAAVTLTLGGSASPSMLRNLAWMSGVALTWAALVGPATMWAPLSFVVGVAIISPTDGEWFTPSRMTLSELSSVQQLLLAGAALVIGYTVSVIDPLRHCSLDEPAGIQRPGPHKGAVGGGGHEGRVCQRGAGSR